MICKYNTLIFSHHSRRSTSKLISLLKMQTPLKLYSENIFSKREFLIGLTDD